MTNREARQKIISEVSRINGFTTLWQPETENVLAVKLGIKAATKAAQDELDRYTSACTRAFRKAQR